MTRAVSELRGVGGTGLRLPAFGFGSARLGELYGRVDVQSRAMLAAAWDGGICHYDTAPGYGRGLSDHRLGDPDAPTPAGRHE